MRIMKPLAAVAAGTLLASGLAVATAVSASAADNGPLLTNGHIYLLNSKTVTLDNATNANVITSGGGVQRPWSTITVDAVCPAGSAQSQSRVRIPQAGVDPINWDEVPFNAQATTFDSQGRPYNASNSNPMTSVKVVTYVASQGGTATLPLTVTCLTAQAVPTGYWTTNLTVVGVDSTLTWSVPAPPAIVVALPASTTTLAASASSVEVGSAVNFTATVAPAAATGTVQFLDGTTSLGSGPVSAGVATFSTSALGVGNHSVTAAYSGDANNAASTSSAAPVTVTVAAPRATTTVLSVSPVTGDAYQNVTLTTAVTAATGLANGTVAFADGSVPLGTVPCVAGVVAPFSTNALGAGAHSLVAVFTGTAPYTSSTSAAVPATYTLVGSSDAQSVLVKIPDGAITITTPYTPAAPLNLGTATLDPSTSTYSASAAFNNIVISDTRAGDLGFTASVISGAFTGVKGGSFGGNYAGLTALAATQVPNNALLANKVVLTPTAPFAPGIGSSTVFAKYAAGQSTGTAQIAGTFGIDKVPSSVAGDVYTATVTFTAV
jgi:hypothetical protein